MITIIIIFFFMSCNSNKNNTGESQQIGIKKDSVTEVMNWIMILSRYLEILIGLILPELIKILL